MRKENEFVNYEENFSELGGFAEFPEDIDGDFESFNRCLADEYLSAMIEENFLELGELSEGLLETIWNWGDFLKISSSDFFNGTFMTCKNRTFIDAIIETHAYQAGEAYLHVNNPKFLAMMIAYSELYEYDLMYDEHIGLSNEEWNNLITETFNELNSIYEMLDNEEKVELLERVKKTIPNITAPKNFVPCKVPDNCLTRKLIKK